MNLGWHLWLSDVINSRSSDHSRWNHILWFLGISNLVSWATMLDLFLNGLIFDSLLLSFLTDQFISFSFDWDLVNELIGVSIWNIFGLVFNGLIISESSLMWDGFSSLNWLVIDMSSLVRNIFDSGSTHDILSLHMSSSSAFSISSWSYWLLYL